jgi:2,5-diamino-6-(ribosylamino)-4(3H)-pyrimidinone 5'-phosphate reductase
MQARPTVTVNMAVTADGKIDTFERRGARISGAADTARVDRLRAEADAVMVGGHTLLGEDPRLTVRDPALADQRRREGREPQPMKVAAVSRIGPPGGPDSLPAASRFLTDGGATVFLATTRATDAEAQEWLSGQGVRLIVHEGPRVDLARLLDELGERGIAQLMVEGGGTLVAALLEAGLVDELQLAVAPLLLGGEDAPTPVAGQGWALAGAVRLALLGTDIDEDDDVILRYRVERGRRHD